MTYVSLINCLNTLRLIIPSHPLHPPPERTWTWSIVWIVPSPFKFFLMILSQPFIHLQMVHELELDQLLLLRPPPEFFELNSQCLWRTWVSQAILFKNSSTFTDRQSHHPLIRLQDVHGVTICMVWVRAWHHPRSLWTEHEPKHQPFCRQQPHKAEPPSLPPPQDSLLPTSRNTESNSSLVGTSAPLSNGSIRYCCSIQGGIVGREWTATFRLSNSLYTSRCPVVYAAAWPDRRGGSA